jgi:ribonucleotide reductase beta subunit family protein with ferritin-like domain
MATKTAKPKKSVAHYVNKIAALQRAKEEGPEAVKRYALFPILDEKGHEFYQKQELTHWSASELDFRADVKWYDAATPRVKKVIDTILAFFLSGDGVVSDNIIFRFLMECQTYEEKSMFISQLHIELVHAETYGLAAFTFKRDAKSMGELIESAQNTSCVKKKMAFMEKWMLADQSRHYRLLAFACAEGIFFCTLFAVIFWFRSKGWFPNFILANELIGNDESLHRDFGAYLFCVAVSALLEPYEPGSEMRKQIEAMIYFTVIGIIAEAVAIEDEFVDYILDEPMEDLNAKDLKTYARVIADNLLVQIGYSPFYKVKNPFTWMDDISMEQKGNFYEVRVGAYKKKSLADILDWKKRAGLVEDKVDVYQNPEDVDF